MSGVPRVTVYVPCHNYGRFLAEALESVVHQSMDAWELVVFTEGSTDETAAVARSFQERFPDRIRVIETPEARGLRACGNAALEMARGEYIIRLDADDYLDESALLVLCHHLDHHPEIGLVYPNWTYVTAAGEPLALERPPRRSGQGEPHDLPMPGACTLIRRRVLKALGGYDTRFTAQDGYEVWLRAAGRFQVATVKTPLFFYRQHPVSMSRNADTLRAARRAIKREMACRQEGSGSVRPRCLAVLEGVGEAWLAGRRRPGSPSPLDAALGNLERTAAIDLVAVSTGDAAVATACEGRPRIVVSRPDPGLTAADFDRTLVIRAAVEDVEARLDFHADIVVIVSVDAPLPDPEQILEVIDTLRLSGFDQVVSVFAPREVLLRHGQQGLEPVNPSATAGLWPEREAVFVANRSVHAIWRDALRRLGLYEGRVGHVVMADGGGMRRDD